MNFNILTEDIHTIAPDLHGFEEQIDRQARSKHHNGACDENGFLRDDSFENKQSLHKNAVEVPQRPHTPPNQCSTGKLIDTESILDERKLTVPRIFPNYPSPYSALKELKDAASCLQSNNPIISYEKGS